MSDRFLIDNKYIWLWGIQSLLLIFLLPCLEYPDASAHFPKVYVNSNSTYYFDLLSQITDFLNHYVLVDDKQFSFDIDFYQNKLSYFDRMYTNRWNHERWIYGLVVSLQLVNVVICLISIFFFNKLVMSNNKLAISEKSLFIKVNMIYYFMPSVSYLMLGITPDFLIYVCQPFIIYFLYQKKYILVLFLSILLLHEDRSAIIDVLFCFICMCYSIIQNIKMKTIYNILIVLTISFVFSWLVRSAYFNYLFVNIGIGNIDMADLIITMQNNEQRMFLPTKILNVFLTSLGLWGTSYWIFPLFYLFWGYFLMKILLRWIKSKKRNSHFDILFISSIIVVFCLIIVIPPYSHIRYFLFSIYMIIWGGFIYVFKNSYVLNDSKVGLIMKVLFVHNVFMGMVIFFVNNLVV